MVSVEGRHFVAQTALDSKRLLEKVSEICLAFPEAIRGIHGDHADFRVRKKVYAYFLDNHHGDGIVSVCVKSELGENVDRARAHPDRYYLPAYLGKKGWFGLYLNRGPIDWSDVSSIVELSYRLAAPRTLLARLP